MAEARRAAIHEAGHAVIGRALSMVCGNASINPDHDSMGQSYIADPLLIYGHWDAQGKYRDYESVLRGRIMAFMAGAEAEIEVLGEPCIGDGDDRLQCAYMAEALEVDGVYLNHLRRHTRRLVRHHRSAIERMAGALLSRLALSDTEIDELIAG